MLPKVSTIYKQFQFSGYQYTFLKKRNNKNITLLQSYVVCNQVPYLSLSRWRTLTLEKIKIGWVLWCIKVQICKHLYCELMHSSNWSTTPLRQWSFQQCLPFSWTTLRGEHCWHPIAVMGVVDAFGQYFNVQLNQTSHPPFAGQQLYF